MTNYTDMLAAFGIGSAHPGGFKKSIAMIMDMNIDERSIVLDCGCGTGQTSAYIKQQFDCEMIALECHPLMIKKAQQRFTDSLLSIDLHQASIEAIPLKPSYVDYALTESVLSFVSSNHALAELYRVLKKSGKLYLNELVCFAPLSADERLVLQNAYGFTSLFSQDQWIDRLTKAGFSTIETMEMYTAESMQNDETDKGNDMRPSESIHSHFYEKMHQHQSLMANYKDKIGHIIIKASKTAM
ncbi:MULTISPECIES: class I SAM-dependent methyltransferase [Bacillaceae]|uniref:class I SAM-dependent methyltransferase n=1 Tax=Shouchella oshimensis TaxID=290588 RepID=UPI0006EC0999|nr:MULTISPECIES: class I SAM-dependent methyltransferase [Bacillaceae]